MFGAIAGLASSVIGSLLNKGGAGDSQQPESGIMSATAGAEPSAAQPAQVTATGSQAKTLLTDTLGKMLDGAGNSIGGAASAKITDLLTGGAKGQGKATRDMLDQAFPELNAWEKAGAGGTMAGTQSSDQDKAVKIAEIQADTQKQIAGLQSATARANTKDQVHAQNELLQYDQALKQQQAYQAGAGGTLAYHQMPLTDAQVENTKAQTRLSGAQYHNTNQDTENKKGATSVVGGMWKDIKTATKEDVPFLYNKGKEYLGKAGDYIYEQAAKELRARDEQYKKAGGLSGAMSGKEKVNKWPKQ